MVVPNAGTILKKGETELSAKERARKKLFVRNRMMSYKYDLQKASKEFRHAEQEYKRCKNKLIQLNEKIEKGESEMALILAEEKK